MNNYHDRMFIANGVSATEFGACLACIPERMEEKIKREKDIPLWSSFSIKCSFDEERYSIVVDAEMKGYLDKSRIHEVIQEVNEAIKSIELEVKDGEQDGGYEQDG